MTTLPAVVRIIDLPTGTTITGLEVFEAIQTVAGVQISVQVPINQVMTTALGGLPTGGGTSQILGKASGASFSAAWYDVTSFISVATTSGLATSGSGTALVVGIATGGISSAQIANNAVGTNQLASSLGVASSLSVGTMLTVGGTAIVTGTTILNGGLQVVGTSLLTGTIGVVGTATFTGLVKFSSYTAGVLVASSTGVLSNQGGMVLLNTLSPNGVASTNDTSSFTNAYSRYMISFDNVTPATNTTSFQMQVATTGGAFISAASYVSMAMINVSSIVVTDTATTAMLITGIRSTTTMQTSTLYGLSGFIYLTNPSNAVYRKGIVGEVSYAGAGAAVGTTTLAQAVINGIFDGNSNAITGVNFLFNSGNIATGTIKIFGIT